MKCETCHSELPEKALFCPNCGTELFAATSQLEFKYAAFICYRHLPHDQEVAIKVQRAIETYRMPRDIAANRNTSIKLGKCFRDEDELAASPSLPDRILEALRQSSALVVICTPDAKSSDWVQREISAFIEIHGPERVFAVLADGRVDESVPDLLRIDAPRELGYGEGAYSNPVAVDLRPGSPRKEKEEMLRLIAGIAQCGFDDLKRRDLARRRRIAVGALIVAAIVIALVVSALIFASESRRNAQIEESRRLAAESTQLLALGDRYGAIECALEALPESTGSNDRPYIPEARAALENALELNASEDSVWRPSYEITTQAPLGLVDSSFAHGADDDVVLAS